MGKSGNSEETMRKMKKSMRTAQGSEAYEPRNAVRYIHRRSQPIVGPSANFLRYTLHSVLY